MISLHESHLIQRPSAMTTLLALAASAAPVRTAWAARAGGWARAGVRLRARGGDGPRGGGQGSRPGGWALSAGPPVRTPRWTPGRPGSRAGAARPNAPTGL